MFAIDSIVFASPDISRDLFLPRTRVESLSFRHVLTLSLRNVKLQEFLDVTCYAFCGELSSIVLTTFSCSNLGFSLFCGLKT